MNCKICHTEMVMDRCPKCGALAGPPFVPTEAPFNAVGSNPPGADPGPIAWSAAISKDKVSGMWEASATIFPMHRPHLPVRANFTRESRIAVMAEVFAFFAAEGK